MMDLRIFVAVTAILGTVVFSMWSVYVIIEMIRRMK